MHSETSTTRKYQMTRLDKGDYLLPSNDAQTLWRLRSYEEDGSAEWYNGTKLTGTYWSVWRWDGRFPSPDLLALAIGEDDWSRWQHWGGPFKTRAEAISEALLAVLAYGT